MQVAIFGGTGRIGAHLVSQVLDSGHQVRVLARDPATLGSAGGLTVITGDVLDRAQVAAVADGADAVLCARGPKYAPAGGRKISRADVAHFMGQLLAEGTWPRSAPALAY
jgi:uncharacterized protein YbjT (DUF2867 family)